MLPKKNLTRSSARWISDQTVGLRITCFLGLLLIGWGPFALIIYSLGAAWDRPNLASTVALVLLYAGFVGLLRWWGWQVHHWHWPLRHCGLEWSHQFWLRLLMALLVGLGAVMGLFSLEVLLGWAVPQATNWKLLGVMTEGLVVAIAVGFAEELLFRGWLLAELEQSWSSGWALVINSGLFAVAHFIKPLPEILRTAPQFWGLWLLGLALVWARRIPDRNNTDQLARQSGNLGLPIGLHSGLIWGYYGVNVGDLIEYSGRVPEWWTGIDANPLSGLLGLIMLGVIAFGFARINRRRRA